MRQRRCHGQSQGRIKFCLGLLFGRHSLYSTSTMVLVGTKVTAKDSPRFPVPTYLFYVLIRALFRSVPNDPLSFLIRRAGQPLPSVVENRPSERFDGTVKAIDEFLLISTPFQSAEPCF